MPVKSPFESFDLNLTADELASEEVAAARDDVFRLAVLSDLSVDGKNKAANNAAVPLARRRFVSIDVDNFDEVMGRMNVELRLSFDEANFAPLTLRFARLDDFHPDRIFESVDVFEKLRRTRDDLSRPQRFAEAAREVRDWLGAGRGEAAAAPPPSDETPESAAEEGGSLLDQMLDASERRTDGVSGESARAPSPSAIAPDDLKDFLRRVVGPHAAPRLDEQQSLIEAVDAAISQLMRRILHHPRFQALEAAWRSLDFLTSRLDLGTELKLYALDVSRDELIADLAGDDLRASNLFKLLVEQPVETAGGAAWSAIIADYVFGPEDAETLYGAAQIAVRAGAPLIAGGGARLLGCPSTLAETPDPDEWAEDAGAPHADAWRALRKQPETSHLGLVVPRILLRLPYGAETDAAENFDFEEMPIGENAHESYLWGNGAFACAELLGRAFSRDGWSMRPGSASEIEGLPLHVYRRDGETLLKPCAEVTLTEHAAEAVMDRGLMPLLSVRDSDAVLLPRFQSVGDPPTRLGGAWKK